jgi:ankyrin repeat protein
MCAVEQDGKMPLHCAVENRGLKGVAELLLENGANVEGKDKVHSLELSMLT